MPVLTQLNGISNKALSSDGLANKLKAQGIVPKPMSLAEYKSFVEAETAKFGNIIADGNIKLGGFLRIGARADASTFTPTHRCGRPPCAGSADSSELSHACWRAWYAR